MAQASSSGDTVRVMIVDDHEIVRRGLAMFIDTRDDLELVADVEDGERAIELCETTKPQVVLMDVIMPGMDGIETTRLLRETYPHIQVIGLTSFEKDENVSKMLEAGAIGYLLKDVSVDDLSAAIHKANAGQGTLAVEAQQALVRVMQQPDIPKEPLTSREFDVLRLMITGMNNREIGEKLFISVSTVKNHVSSIFVKLDAGSRSEAVALALRHKIIDP